MTVRFLGLLSDPVRPSGVPAEFAAGANETLARIVLRELVQKSQDAA